MASIIHSDLLLRDASLCDWGRWGDEYGAAGLSPLLTSVGVSTVQSGTDGDGCRDGEGAGGFSGT